MRRPGQHWWYHVKTADEDLSVIAVNDLQAVSIFLWQKYRIKGGTRAVERIDPVDHYAAFQLLDEETEEDIVMTVYAKRMERTKVNWP